MRDFRLSLVLFSSRRASCRSAFQGREQSMLHLALQGLSQGSRNSLWEFRKIVEAFPSLTEQAVSLFSEAEWFLLNSILTKIFHSLLKNIANEPLRSEIQTAPCMWNMLKWGKDFCVFALSGFLGSYTLEIILFLESVLVIASEGKVCNPINMNVHGRQRLPITCGYIHTSPRISHWERNFFSRKMISNYWS